MKNLTAILFFVIGILIASNAYAGGSKNVKMTVSPAVTKAHGNTTSPLGDLETSGGPASIIYVPKGVAGWGAIVDPQTGERWTQKYSANLQDWLGFPPGVAVVFESLVDGSKIRVHMGRRAMDYSEIETINAWQYKVDFICDDKFSSSPVRVEENKIKFNPKNYKYHSVFVGMPHSEPLTVGSTELGVPIIEDVKFTYNHRVAYPDLSID